MTFRRKVSVEQIQKVRHSALTWQNPFEIQDLSHNDQCFDSKTISSLSLVTLLYSRGLPLTNAT